MIYVNRSADFSTYVHELLHLLFPSRPHYWIFSAAFRLTDDVKARWVYGRVQTASAIPDNKARLLKLTRAAALRRGLSKKEEPR